MRMRAWITGALALGVCVGASSVMAATKEEVAKALAAAEELRAPEFAPLHYEKAKALFKQAEEEAAKDPERAARTLDAAKLAAEKAAELAEQFARAFASLVEMRDKMQLVGADQYRPDLVARAEEQFRKVAEAFEDGEEAVARRNEKIASDLIKAAQVVAAREKFAAPLGRMIAAARKVKAREFAPKAFGRALAIKKKLDKLVKNDPERQAEAHALSEEGLAYAKRALGIGELGSRFAKTPAEVERWVDEEDARLALIAKMFGVGSFPPDADAEAIVKTIQSQLAALKESYEAEIADREQTIAQLQKQLAEMNERLAQYEGKAAELEKQFAEMELLRKKLRIKREAEAKIKQIGSLFAPEEAEVLLTPEADVILRMRGINFRSGSAVIPPAAYALLDRVLEVVRLFPDRKIRVEGHTDSVGSAEYNQKLSERRAEAVRDYLLKRLGDAAAPAIEAIGFGESRPIANNETAEGRRKNRRIDIVFVAPRVQAKTEGMQTGEEAARTREE